jgi:hypothetical protein
MAMAMFGQGAKLEAAKRRRVEEAALGNTERPMGPPSDYVPPQRSRFGAFGRAMQAAGDFMNPPVGREPGFLQTMLFGTDWADERRDRGWQQERMQRQRAEWQRADDERQRFESWLSTLPPEHQGMARIQPEAYIKAYLQAQGQSDDKLMEVSPGATVYDPATGQAVFRAPPNPTGGANDPNNQPPWARSY